MTSSLLAAVLLAWQAGPVLLGPGAPGSFDETAVKDPSVVRFQWQWHIFYTARGRHQYTLGYVAASRLEDLGKAKRHQLTQLHGKSAYAAAPQVFYFRPQQQWYLIFQTTDSNYQPMYSTTSLLDRPESWSVPQPLAAKQDKGKWIDFWVLCDDSRAYLYYTREHQEVFVMSTPLRDFPGGWSAPKRIFSPVHEAVHVYSVQGATPRYLMLYEQNLQGRRHFGKAESTTPNGPWQAVEESFASGEKITFLTGTPAWTSQVSHGELLRHGHDERLEIAPPLRFLIQGMPAAQHQGDYAELTWSLGLIEQK